MDIVPDEGLEGDHFIRKRLSGSEGVLKGSDNASVNVVTKTAGYLLDYGNGVSPGESPVSAPQKVQPPKWHRKMMNGVESEDMIGSKIPSEEDRREQ
jgi:hypothetical protein